jgi:hypothetical protein
MVEFGNQHFWMKESGHESPLDKYYTNEEDRKVFKHWANLNGISHVSIDINGKSGALPYDLSIDLSTHNKLTQAFDMGTDFGTIEHIPNQYWAWKNMYNFLKPDGIVMHVLPLVGSWKNHPLCHWRYTKEFFNELCRVCNYSVIEVEPYDNIVSPDVSIYAIYQKMGDSKFPLKEEFDFILQYYAESSLNG